jgi:hypothetical protein
MKKEYREVYSRIYTLDKVDVEEALLLYLNEKNQLYSSDKAEITIHALDGGATIEIIDKEELADKSEIIDKN